MIVFNNVYFSYHNSENEYIPVLEGLNLTVSKGEFLLLLGGNGSGKTTLLKLICGLLLPARGTVHINGLDTRCSGNGAELASAVSMVLSRPRDMIFSPIVEEDVAFGLECRGWPPQEIRSKVDQSLRMVNMTQFRRAQTNQLSGGEQQKVVLAGALSQDPQILLLDEPTAYLDSGESRLMLELVRKIREKSAMTLLLATQRPNLAHQPDRILVLQQGKPVFNGPPSEFLNRSEILKAAGLTPSKTTLLGERLRKKGIPVKNPCNTPDLLEKQLCELWSRTSLTPTGKVR